MSNINNAVMAAFDKGYRVNDLGDVVSPKGRIRKKRLHGKRVKYYEVNFIYNRKSIPVRIHKLCAYQKYGNAAFIDKIEIRHLDGNSLNNSPINISIGTQSENAMDVPVQERIKKAKYASSFLIRKDWPFIDKDRAAGFSYKQLVKKYGISAGALSYRYSKPTRP